MCEPINRWLSDAQRSASQRAWQYVEVVGLTLSVPAIALLWGAPDPFLLRSSFPWLVLVPLLIAVQHGLGAALASAGLLCAGVGVRQAFGLEEAPNFGAWSAGCFLVALLAGWLKDRASSRERDSSAHSLELEDRWQRLARAHDLLALSHSQLEERLVAQGWSLESVVQRATRELSGAPTPVRIYGVVLDVLASQAQLLAVSFFAASPLRSVRSPEPVRLDAAACACLGKPRQALAGASPSAHPIVRRALLTGQVALLAPEPAAADVDESVLAALPLAASNGRVLGVVVVHEMSFLAFTPSTFAELDTILRCLADAVDARLAELRAGSPHAQYRSGVRLRRDGSPSEPAEPSGATGRARSAEGDAAALSALSAAIAEEPLPDSSAALVGGRRG